MSVKLRLSQVAVLGLMWRAAHPIPGDLPTSLGKHLLRAGLCLIAEGAEGRDRRGQTGKDAGDKHLEVVKTVMNDGEGHSRYSANSDGGRAASRRVATGAGRLLSQQGTLHTSMET